MTQSDDEEIATIASSRRNLPRPLVFEALNTFGVQGTPASPTTSTTSRSSRAVSPDSIAPTTPTSPRSSLPVSTTQTTPASTKSGPPASTRNSPVQYKSSLPFSAKSSVWKDSQTIQSAPESLSQLVPNDSVSPDHEDFIIEAKESKQVSPLNKLVQRFANLASSLKSAASKGQVTKVINLIRSIDEGTLEGGRELIKRKLTTNQYEQLLVRIAEDQSLQAFFNDKLRFDYTHEDSEFIIRMPSFVHEGILERMNWVVIEQLSVFKQSGGKVAELAKRIYGWGSPDIQLRSTLKGKYNQKSPDKTYGHKDCQSTYPGLVVEVAYSQDQSELSELAKKYIEGSNGETRTMVGIDIDYKHTPGGYARFLVWRARKDKGAIKAILSDPGTKFRNDDGKEVSGVSLRLFLTDFVCPKIAESFTDVEDSIIISAEDLCEALAQGEEKQFQHRGNEQDDLRTTQDSQHTRGSTSKIKEQGKALLRKSKASATRRSARQQGLKAPIYAE